MAVISSRTVANTATFRTSHMGYTSQAGRRPMSEGVYEAPPHVVATTIGGRSCGRVGTPDGGTYEQFTETFEFSGARHGDVIRVYPWRHEYHVYKTSRGLVVDEVPALPR